MNDEYRTALTEGEQAGCVYKMLLPRQALAGIAGARTGVSPGSSLEFKDFRDYQPGDDLRRIDWGAYARSDRLTVRIYHDEVLPHVDIGLDGSQSMALPDTPKPRAALRLAAFFAMAAANSGCTCVPWLASRGFHRIANGNDRPSAWSNITFDDDRPLPESFSLLAPRWRRHGIRVLISDLLWLGDPMNILRQLVDGAARVVVLQLLAQNDREPPQHGNATLVDSETGEEQRIFIDAVARRRYQEALTGHVKNWQHACRQVGALFLSLTAERVIDGTDLKQLAEMQLVEIA